MDASPGQNVFPSTTMAPPPPRRFQFTLGTMLAAATIVSALLGLLTLHERGLPGLFYTLLVVLLLRATRSQPPAARSLDFGGRQFDGPMTGRQWTFDILFGILLPLFCLWADFFVFQIPPIDPPHPDSMSYYMRDRPTMVRPFLWSYKHFAYVVTGMQISMLLAWLILKNGLARQTWFRPAAAVLGGALISGSVIALLLGMFLLPFATVGLILMLTGALGYTPLLTAFVYYRQGRAAVRVAQAGYTRPISIALALLGSLAVAAAFLFLWRGPSF